MCLIIVLISVNGIWEAENKGFAGEDFFFFFLESRLPLPHPQNKNKQK